MFQKLSLCLVAAAFAVTGCEKTTVEGPNDKKLTLMKPSDSTIQRGDTEKVSIVVTRSNFDGQVTVSFNNLPQGVTLVDNANTIEGNERTFVLKASDTAPLVENHVATVTVRGPDGMTATEEYRITVKEK